MREMAGVSGLHWAVSDSFSNPFSLFTGVYRSTQHCTVSPCAVQRRFLWGEGDEDSRSHLSNWLHLERVSSVTLAPFPWLEIQLRKQNCRNQYVSALYLIFKCVNCVIVNIHNSQPARRLLQVRKRCQDHTRQQTYTFKFIWLEKSLSFGSWSHEVKLKANKSTLEFISGCI